MRKPGRKRPNKYKIKDDIPVEEFIDAWFEILGRPGTASAVKVRADAEGISLDVAMCEIICRAHHRLARPLPQTFREYIAKHPGMSERRRKNLLKRDDLH
jgi:hypothetical protein